MMIDEFLSYLRGLDVKIWADGDRLRCDAPKGVLTPDLRAELAERKAEILLFLREAAAMARSSPAPIEPVSRDEDLPLSFAQQRLWFLDRMELGIPAYNIPLAVQLTGQLDATALERSLNEIVRRHEALRTTFASVDGHPLQVIAPTPSSSTLPVVDLRGLEDVEREAQGRRRAREEARQPFDLERGPLIRAKLLRLGEEEHVLLVGMHHIVSDGWSMGVLWRELATLYEAFSVGEASPLPELPIQYADYAVWQRRWLQGDVLERHLSYWKRRLEGAPTALELPVDRPRPPVQTFRGERRSLTLPESLTEALEELSRREGGTLFMALLAVFQTLLHRYTGQDDVVVGSPIANRNRAEIEGLIGFFANTLALRTDLSGDPTFLELLGRVREVAMEAYAHQDLPFEKLVEELNPERDLSRTPLFQAMFVLQNVPRQILELPGLALTRMEVERGTAKFDLTLSVVEGPEGLKGTFEYNTDLFEADTIERMLGHFRTLLEGVVADPERRVSELPLLTEAERRQMLIEWNDTPAAYPKDKCVHELFEEQVRRAPETVAVEFEGEQLTYRELNRRANQLAHHLRGLGVGPEVLVGICMERSVEMVVGLLGILKAGGAYVPLDPSYPEERLSFMLEDVQAPVLLTQERLVERLPRHHAARLIRLDADRPIIAREREDNPDGGATADDLAYVVYTSGSTGVPKGVCVEHRSVVRLVRHTDYLEFRSDEVFLQLAPFTFDASTLEIWGPLLNGGRLAIAPPGYLSLAELAATIRRHGVTTLWLTAGLFHQLVDTNPAALSGVGTLLAGGDVLSPAHVREALRRLPGIRLINGYGPTENTTFTCCFPVSPAALPPDGDGSIPIGKPIANTRAYVLDAHWRPVPIGVAGELYAGGDGLARGYLNRPELTAEKFVPDPFGDAPGARLYRTGDLARYLPDGNIEFLGRLDHQVKIRGFRVELGEVEAVLGRCPAVREAVVLAREDEPGDKRLVAYVVVDRDSPPTTTAELRSFLRAKLPEYMVPSAFVVLEALPLTPNGKVDRKALPAPDRRRLGSDGIFVPPRNAIEETLAGIWAEVLGVERVGIHDDFFDLGGHSLLATQVVSRVREAFQVELPLRCLFEAPTVAGLAERIGASRRGTQRLPAPPPLPVPRDGRPPLSFAQGRLWFLQQLKPGDASYNIHQAIRAKGALDVGALRLALEAIAARHEALRTTFAVVNQSPVQVIAPAPSMSLPLADLSGLPKSEREAEALRLAREEAQRPFGLKRGPLWRAKLLRLGEEEHILLLTMHHIISDGWSMGVLWRELAALYAAFVAGEASPLPELPVQYADYAVWQRRWLQGGALETQLAYWKRQLADLPALRLPTDRPRPAVQTHRGARQSLALPESLSEALKELSHREGVTLFMTLLAAFQALLSRYTGQEDIAVGTPIAGRNRAETEGLIGFFVNTLVLRADLSGDPTFLELLRRVREVCLGAYDHQEVPFEKLVEELQPQRDMSRSPLFEVMFVLQNTPGQALELPGLRLTRLEVERGTAKFDLTLSMVEGPEGLRGACEYNTDLFDAATITRMLEHFRTLLEGIVADPGQRLSALPVLTEAQRHQLLVEWNDTRKDYPRDACIHELFEAQAERTPDAVAVVFEEERLTYRELDRKANQLAHHLRKLGVGPEVLVGICVERSLEMAVGLLGILKAGGAYVPLDPSYPKERLAFMLEDARVPVLLTQQRLLGYLPASASKVVCLDADRHVVAKESEANPISGATAKNLAYVIYTSGSTGTPKGVMIEHRSLVNYLRWVNDVLMGDTVDSLPWVTRPTFDASLKQLFAPLLRGREVWVPAEDAVAEPVALLQTLDSRSEVALNCVPSLWEAVLDAIHSGRVTPTRSLVALFVGGDRLSRELVGRSFRTLPGLRIWNLYGPTEATANASAGEVVSQDDVSLGRPLANTQIYLLDRHLRPAPIGVPGELYIGGAGVARGYLDRPDLTAEKFVPDPFGEEPGARLYKTGDVGRYLPDGNIEYLGRLDEQVKIRGFRIEPGEVEAALAEHPAVREAVVVAHEDKPGEARLLSYVVTHEQPAPTLDDLRSFLRERLPEYMLPSALVVLDELPRTPHGKADRRALPAPDRRRLGLDRTFVPPRNPIEETLAAIWAEVLGVERVGVRDDFFELGGHSLLAVRLASRLSAALDTDVPVRLLVAHPTVEALADAIEQLRRAGEEASTTRAVPPMTAIPASPLARPDGDSVSRTLRIERRPLLSLFAAGRLAPVDAAALTYLPDDLPARAGLSREEIRALWYDELPTLTGVLETFLGRIALIALPRFARELYEDRDDLVGGVVEALAMSGGLGARAVSLTGLIPSATDYGRAIAARIGRAQQLPAITTGHATTAATVVLTTERLLEEAGRDLGDAHLGVLGWGSIGRTSLRLLLRALPHPAAITVCDVYGFRDRAADIRQELAEEVGYRGPVRVVESRGEVPAEFYESTVMLGATNVANVLDISGVRPGTVIVDDSGPHCFSVPAAVQRLQEAGDILFTEGGVLRSPRPIERVRYLPRIAEQTASAPYLESIARHDPHRITGCVLAGLLCARLPDLEPTVGLASDDVCLRHYERLRRLGFAAADPHCKGHALAPEAVRGFRQRFGATLSLPSAPTRAHDRV